MNKIFVEQNFLTDRECDYLIDLHHRATDHHYHRDTKTTLLNGLYAENNYIRHFLTKLSFLAQSCYNDSNIYLNYAEVVEWQGVGMLPHKDFTCDVATAVVYLNDDYEGGETFIDDIVITPKRGKVVCFNGDESSHGVNDFTNTRYTIASWFCNGKHIVNLN